jgi:thioredoxin/glutathione reductase (selenoprotein)
MKRLLLPLWQRVSVSHALRSNRVRLGVATATGLSLLYAFKKSDSLQYHADSDTNESQQEKIITPPYVQEHGYNVDLIIIGGGSGGIAAAKQAAQHGAKVVILDYVESSNTENERNPKLGAWSGVGGTCLHVGCIPKKLWHKAALIGDEVVTSESLGWDFLQLAMDQKGSKLRSDYHSWNCLVANVQRYIENMSAMMTIDLVKNGIAFLNARGSFVDDHTVLAIDKHGNKYHISAKHIILATGSRPKFPDIPGARKYGISSDDIFSLQEPPGKTLIVGGSYVALETAGFLTGLGHDITVMVRSDTVLHSFDQPCVSVVVNHMRESGTKFLFSHQLESVSEKKVVYKDDTGQIIDGEYDTVMFAIGRAPVTSSMGLDKIGVKVNEQGKVIVDEYERTSVDHIYAIGDINANGQELTPVAICAGRLLASRLFGSSKLKMDYSNVPTTIFTPMEYASVGLTELEARRLYGDNLNVYNRVFKNIGSLGFVKMICSRDDERVLGFHFVGENAGEVTQGVAVGIKAGITKQHFDTTVGIHPTAAEIMTNLRLGETSDFTC